MENKFKTKVTRIGNLSKGLVDNGYLVIFDENVDDFASNFGYTVKHSNLNNNLEIGDTVKIGSQNYIIKEISDNTNEFLSKESHVTFIINEDFDDIKQIKLEGAEEFPNIVEGTEIIIY